MTLIHSAFVLSPSSIFNRSPAYRLRHTISRRSFHKYSVPIYSKARGSGEQTSPSNRKEPKGPSSSKSDSFSGFAAGPSVSSTRRISRQKTDEKSTESEKESTSKTDFDVSNQDQITDEKTSPSSPETLRAVRALGKPNTEKIQPFTQRKTAADFISEGIVDDTEESSPFSISDIRFGIDDVKDPFKEDSQKKDAERNQLEQQEAEQVVGQALDVTGDGSVTKVVLTKGSGTAVPSNAKVTVEYTGKLEDGTVFDTSRKRDSSFSFQLGTGAVIKGWEAAVSTMRVGEVAEFTIKPAYAYGKRGMPPVIPGNSTLTFEIEVLDAQGEGELEDEVKSVADFNPDMPRTPEEIARNYEERLKSKEERDKNMSFLERFYIISPFMSQTGEKPPWWINPNITFFLITVFIAIGVYLVVISGAVHVGYVDRPVDVNIFK